MLVTNLPGIAVFLTTASSYLPESYEFPTKGADDSATSNGAYVEAKSDTNFGVEVEFRSPDSFHHDGMVIEVFADGRFIGTKLVSKEEVQDHVAQGGCTGKKIDGQIGGTAIMPLRFEELKMSELPCRNLRLAKAPVQLTNCVAPRPNHGLKRVHEVSQALGTIVVKIYHVDTLRCTGTTPVADVMANAPDFASVAFVSEDALAGKHMSHVVS